MSSHPIGIPNTYRALSNIHLDTDKCGVALPEIQILCIGRCPKVAALKSGAP